MFVDMQGLRCLRVVQNDGAGLGVPAYGAGLDEGSAEERRTPPADGVNVGDHAGRTRPSRGSGRAKP